MCATFMKIRPGLDDHDEDLSNQSGTNYGISEEVVQGQCAKKVTSNQNAFDQYHHFEVKRNKTEVFCVRCGSKKPLSLQKICKLQIVRNENLTIVACRQLPADLVENLMKTAIYLLKFVGLNDIIEPSIKVLLKYYPREVFDVASMKTSSQTRSVINALVLGFLSEVLEARMSPESTDENVSKLREFKMVTTYPCFMYTDSKFRCRKFYETLLEIATKIQMQRNSDLEPQIKYIITTDIYVEDLNGLQRTVSALRVCRQPSSPFEIRIIRAYFDRVHISDIAAYWQDMIKPEFLEELSVKKTIDFSPEDILVIDEVLTSCVRLSHLSLSQYCNNLNYDPKPILMDCADAMPTLLRCNQSITTLSLSGFYITGHAAKYHLPSRLEALWLSECVMTQADWEYWANNDLPNVGNLKVLCIYRCYHTRPSDGHGFLKFLQKHSETLTVLEISIQPSLTFDILQEIATTSKCFKVLKEFYFRLNYQNNTLELINKAMPLYFAIESLECFTLIVRRYCYEGEPQDIDIVKLSLEAAFNSVERPKPLDFAKIIYV